MKKKNNTKPILFLLICSLFGYVLYSSISSPECKLHPITKKNFSDPENLISEIITEHKGLPKTTVSRHDLHSEESYPVKNWEISNQLLQQNGAIINGSTKYSYRFDVNIEFEDGDEKVLEWSERRVGFVFCPFVIDRGFFSPARLKIQ